jgi:hypothetical protein
LANQQQPEVHARRQAQPSHDFRIEWLTLTFDKIIEVVLGQPLIQSRVEWVTVGKFVVATHISGCRSRTRFPMDMRKV